MVNMDKDKRFMAARDLTNLLASPAQNICSTQQHDIFCAFIEHLEDSSLEVQANSVKSLEAILPRYENKYICMYIDMQNLNRHVLYR